MRFNFIGFERRVVSMIVHLEYTLQLCAVVLLDHEYFLCTVQIWSQCIYREWMDLLEVDGRNVRIDAFSL